MRKVFCIGLNKTATSSLSNALTILGYKVLHDDWIARKAIEQEYAQGKKILSSIDEYQAFADIPFDSMFRELDQAYPDSKFILTTRDLYSWLLSRAKHVRRNRRSIDYRGEALIVNKTRWEQLWNMHHDSVKNWFKERPEKLLVIDICGGDGWEKLCPFLEKQIPENTPFPRDNQTNTKPDSTIFLKIVAPPFQIARAVYHRLCGRYPSFDYGWSPGSISKRSHQTISQ